ncbi:hypothetical protein [Streptomyces sp. NPDC048252]|uniref:hypothetical protein n=1 Tax=Streptomyces sp. NPDC048252 TaxID=3154612 RepID=UPI003431EF58
MTDRKAAAQSGRRVGRAYSAHFHLLDRQVVDPDGHPVCKVDDLELAHDEHGRPYVSAILIGPAALAPRLGGKPARWLASVQQRLKVRRQEGPARLDFGCVTGIGAAVTIGPPTGGIAVHALEDWTRDNVIGRLPGAGHAAG